MGSPLDKIKEVGIINHIAKGLKAKGRDVIVSIGDDAAVVAGKSGKYLLYTSDMLIESVHFKKNESLKKIGYKAMAVSISDIAAMGGEPKHALVSIGLPPYRAELKARQLFSGIKACAQKYHVDVIGGDTNRSEKLIVDVFMVGEVERRYLVLRSGAKKGDHIFVSGSLGGSLKGRHLVFCPRLEAARFLVGNFKVTSMIDLSDGLSMDLNRICAASGTGALIFEGQLPKNKGVLSTESALCDGEDFELLFTLSPKDSCSLLRACCGKGARLVFYPVGVMTDSSNGVRLVRKNGEIEAMAPKGFRHF